MACGEILARQYMLGHGLRIVVARLFNTVGPHLSRQFLAGVKMTFLTIAIAADRPRLSVLAAQTNQHVFIYPAEDAWTVYEPFALYTLHNNMTLNWGYFSRANYAEIANFGRHTWEDLKADHVAKDTLFIIWGDDALAQAKQFLSDKMLICQIDGYEVAFSPNNPVVQSGFDLKPYCAFP